MTLKVCGCHDYLELFTYADLVGKPYSEGARGPEAYDCLGLAIEIQRRRGFIVPDFLSSEAELHAQLAGGGFLAGCERLEAAEYGCVALILNSNLTHHLGTMIAKHRMIHTTAQTRGAVIESILGPLWQRRIVGFYALGKPGCEPMQNPWSPA
jgi:cell wall-associated NlpC family hydrolase